MMTCMESYACICENLAWNPSGRAKEALDVIREFRNIFETADAAMQDPILQEICRTLPALHFETALPLDTKPVETIQREYQKRTGKTLSPYFCTIAYHNTLKADRKNEKNTGTPDADTREQNPIQRLKGKAELNCCRDKKNTYPSKGGN